MTGLEQENLSVPLVSLSIPAKMDKREDLPHPLVPTIVTMLPFYTFILIFRIARISPSLV